MNIRITDKGGLKPTFTQWDVDRVLLISGCESQPSLRFDNPELSRSIVVVAEADGADWKCNVPNFILQFSGPMIVSVFIQPDEGKTVFTARYAVQWAKKPQDYTYEENIGYTNWVQKTEEAQDLLDDIEDLRDEIQTAVDTATSASEAAVAAAEDIDETVAAALQAAKDSGDFDGADGQDGQDGAPGPKGDPGEDGVSPRFSSTAITGGHRIAVQDAYGDYTFDVMNGTDGEDGAPGVGVPSGGSAGDVLRKASGTDYDTEWHSPEIFWAVYDSTTADEIEAARIDGKAIMCAWGGKTYVMNYRQNATKFYFTAADRNALYHISVSGSSWSNMSTKTVGTYFKPSGGIPKTDLASAVQTSLGKADTALQSAPVTSVNGQTGAVTVPEPFFATYSTSDMTTWTCDKTFAQITAAMAAGKQVVMIGSVGGVPIAQSCDTMLADYGTHLDFWIRYGRNGWYHIIHNDDDSIEFYDAYIDSQDLDAVASNQGTSEAGKFLVVGPNGIVTTVSVPSAQGVNF